MPAIDPHLHRRIYELRELDGARWSQIAQRLGIPEPNLAKLRKRAVDEGRAVKQPNGRVTWLPPRD